VHFVFREDNGRTTSLFVDEHPRGALPADGTSEGGFAVSGTATPRHQIMVVSDPARASDAFVHDMLEQSTEFARRLER
jgi:hypothetical protein